MWAELLGQEATGELVAAWIGKEEVCDLLAFACQHGPVRDQQSAVRVLNDWCARADVSEATALANYDL